MHIIIFTDGSVNTKTKVGYGAYSISVGDSGFYDDDLVEAAISIGSKITVKQFTNTSSTTLELQMLLWAINTLPFDKVLSITAYTDSQNIISLLSRRAHLESNNYISKNQKQLKNHALYKEFYQIMDKVDCRLIKVAGHQPKHTRNAIEQHFSLVDQAARQALRSDS